MAFPPAHLLVGAGAAELVRVAVPVPRGRAWALAAGLAVVPDLDFAIGMLRGNADLHHGTFSHSIAVTVCVALLVGIGWGGRWAVLAGVGYGSHLLVDLLDARGRTNVLLWWPWRREGAPAVGPLFPKVKFEQGRGFWHALRSLAEPEVFAQLAVQTLLGLATFVVLLALARGLRHVSKRV